jgi:hypothetical protein
VNTILATLENVVQIIVFVVVVVIVVVVNVVSVVIVHYIIIIISLCLCNVYLKSAFRCRRSSLCGALNTALNLEWLDGF